MNISVFRERERERGTLLVFKSGKINSVGIKQPNHFLELDKWIESKIDYV